MTDRTDAGGTRVNDHDPDARVGEHEAVSEIRRILAAYVHGIDGHDIDLLLDNWHPEGRSLVVDDTGTVQGDFIGRDEIEGWIRATWAALPQSHHIAGEPLIDVDGSRARVVSQVFATATDERDRALILGATYRDEFRSTDGRWLLFERRADLHYWLPFGAPWQLDPAQNVQK